MRFYAAIVLALPALAVVGAEEPPAQRPLADKVKAWFSRAGAKPSAAANEATGAVAVAAAAAAKVQHRLTKDNWRGVLTTPRCDHCTGPHDWLVFVTGGNATCFGLCDNATAAWNESVVALSALPASPNFAVLDCEAEPVLCNAWSAGPPALYHFSIPRPLPDQSRPSTTARYIPLNRTTVSAREIADLVANKGYKATPPYQGVFHPFDGALAQLNLAIPLGFILYAVTKVPSWLPIMLVSLLSRTFMSRRAPPSRQRRQPNAAGPAGPAPATAVN